MPAGAPVGSFVARTGLPKLIAARNFPVEARSAIAAGEGAEAITTPGAGPPKPGVPPVGEARSASGLAVHHSFRRKGARYNCR